MIENIYSIIQGHEQGIEQDETSDGIEEIINEDDGETEDKEDDVYVAIGQKVWVKVIETKEVKTIAVDYIRDTDTIPPLAKMLLGRRIGDSVEFLDKTYQIERV